MHHRLGKELKRLIVWASVLTLGLFLLVVIYFMIDVAVTSNKNVEENKQLVIEESVLMMEEMADNIRSMNNNADLISYMKFEDVAEELAQGKTDQLFKVMMDMALIFYPIEYVGEVQNGEVLVYQTVDGSALDTSALPPKPADGDYVTLDEFAGKEGFFISLYYPISVPFLGNLESNYIMDRTADIRRIENYFNDQRNAQLTRMAIVSAAALILFALLTTLGLRLLVGKFVMQPIDTLNDQAQGIIDGTLEEEVPYDPDSSFAPIQGVLQTGQKVLMDMLHGQDG